MIASVVLAIIHAIRHSMIFIFVALAMLLMLIFAAGLYSFCVLMFGYMAVYYYAMMIAVLGYLLYYVLLE